MMNVFLLKTLVSSTTNQGVKKLTDKPILNSNFALFTASFNSMFYLHFLLTAPAYGRVFSFDTILDRGITLATAVNNLHYT